MQSVLFATTTLLTAALWSLTAFAQYGAAPAIPAWQTVDVDATLIEKYLYEQGLLVETNQGTRRRNAANEKAS